MTASTQWAPAFTTATAAGCAVHTFRDTAAAPYMHEKIIVVDQVKVLIGSQNASSTCSKNRELSIQIAAAPIVSAVEKTFDSDCTAAPAWKKASS